MQVLNSGTTPTFDTVRGGKVYSSHVDLTVCSVDLIGLVEEWRVDIGFTSADHDGIVFNIRQNKCLGINVQTTTRLYNTKKVNSQSLKVPIYIFSVHVYGTHVYVVNHRVNTQKGCVLGSISGPILCNTSPPS